MRKIIILIMSILAFALSALSAKILVWHFNPGDYDYYEDPEAKDTIDCAYWITKSLTANGYTFDYHKDVVLPSDISTYDVIIGTLGFFFC